MQDTTTALVGWVFLFSFGIPAPARFLGDIREPATMELQIREDL